MATLRDGFKQTFIRPNWTLISLVVYLALPLTFLSSSLIDLVISILVWSGGIIAYFRSQTTWQKALCLQFGLIFTPIAADAIVRIFWSNARWWQNISPQTPLIVPLIFLSFGLPWLGLMFTPGLFALMYRLIFSPPFSSSAKDKPLLSWRENDFQRPLLLWVGATFAGLAIPVFPLPTPIRVLVWIFLLGILQEVVLRRFSDVKGWWILATAGGLVSGVYLSGRFVVADLYLGPGFGSIELDPLLIYSTQGAVVGLCQWLILKRYVKHAYWWVLVNMVSWPVAWMIPIDGYTEWLGMALVVGIATGLLLIWLMRFPNPVLPHPLITYEPNHP